MALCLLIAGMEVEAYAIRFEHSDLLLAYVRASMMMGQPIADEQDDLGLHSADGCHACAQTV